MHKNWKVEQPNNLFNLNMSCTNSFISKHEVGKLNAAFINLLISTSRGVWGLGLGARENKLPAAGFEKHSRHSITIF